LTTPCGDADGDRRLDAARYRPMRPARYSDIA